MFVFSLRLFDFQSYKDNNTSQSIPKGQEGCERMAGEKSRAEENLCSFFKCLRLQLSNQYGFFQKVGVPQNGWFIIYNGLLKKDDLEVPLFLETPLHFRWVSFFEKARFPFLTKPPRSRAMQGCWMAVAMGIPSYYDEWEHRFCKKTGPWLKVVVP